MPDLPPQSPVQEQVATALADCGLDRGGIIVSYDNDLEADVIRIKVNARASDSQFACIFAATSGEEVSFEVPALQEGYAAYSEAALRPQMVASARKSLADVGKLVGLPQLGSFNDTTAFFRTVEIHCGWRAGEALQEVSPGDWTIAPEALRNIEPQDERAMCLLAAWKAQDEDLEARGLRLGFIGNAARGD